MDNNQCEYNKDNKEYDCGYLFDCCDCGGNDCGCAYCFSCNACENCLKKEE